MIPVRSQWGHYSLPRLMEYKWNLVVIYGDYNYSWENQHIDYRVIVRWSYSDDMEIVHRIVRLSRGNQPFWSNSWIIGMVFIPKIDGDMFLICSWYVLDMFLVCSWWFLDVFLICSWYVLDMFLVCSWWFLDVFLICSWCVLDMFLVCSWWFLDVFLICSWCVFDSWCVLDMFWSPCTFSQHQITKQSVMPSTFLSWWVLRTPPTSCHLWVLEDYFPLKVGNSQCLCHVRE